jgi:ribosomal protein S12 methylthiotransferase
VVKDIDMPLQHADDGMLRAMKRERSTDALRRLLDRVRKAIPAVALRTSFIVGFPGETEAAFTNLVDFVREQRFDRMGVFTYSREENTAACELGDQVPERIKRRRRAELMEVQGEISLEKNRDLVGREIEVMVEGAAPGRATRLRARTSAQAPEIDGMVLLSGEAEPGDIVRARIERATTYDLHGRITGAVAQL